MPLYTHDEYERLRQENLALREEVAALDSIIRSSNVMMHVERLEFVIDRLSRPLLPFTNFQTEMEFIYEQRATVKQQAAEVCKLILKAAFAKDNPLPVGRVGARPDWEENKDA